MSKSEERKKYSVYVHKCPDGMVYVGSTSLLPCRRYNGGYGYKGNPEFYEAIQKWGWKNISHDVVMTCDSKTTASMLEKVMICSVLPEKSFNKNSFLPNTSFFPVYDAVGVMPRFSSELIVEYIGDSANKSVVESYMDYEKNCKDWGSHEDRMDYYKNYLRSLAAANPNQQIQYNMKKEKVKARTMNWKIIKGVKIEIMLDTRYEHTCGGYPVCIRIYKDRKYKYFRTEYVMTVSEFMDMDSKDEEYINKMFNYYCNKIRDYENDVTYSYIQALPDYTQTSSVDAGSDISELFEEKASLCVTMSTARGYRDTLKKINEAFPNGLKLTDINVSTVSEFKTYMHEHGINDTSINIHLTKLKACVNYGIYKGYIKESQYPFKRTGVEIDKVTLPKGEKRDTEYITIEDMHKIWDWFMNSKKPNKYIGYFLFSYLHGGINVADMMYLKFDDFYFRERGFIYQRKKTLAKNNFKVFVPATKWTDALLERMGITPTSGKCVFAGLSFDGTEKDYNRVKSKASTSINRVVKMVAKELGIGDISMTTARHSFATIASKNRMPYMMIEQAMGHANTSVSGHYIGGFSLDEMRPDFELLL